MLTTIETKETICLALASECLFWKIVSFVSIVSIVVFIRKWTSAVYLKLSTAAFSCSSLPVS